MSSIEERAQKLIDKANEIFGKVRRPAHFTNYTHCEECADHDRVLLEHDPDSISLKELGNPGWDPLCYVNPQGFKFYFPALVRLSVQDENDFSFITQVLFHLDYDKDKNRFLVSFTSEEREFVVTFLREFKVLRELRQKELTEKQGEWFWGAEPDEELDKVIERWSGSTKIEKT